MKAVGFLKNKKIAKDDDKIAPENKQVTSRIFFWMVRGEVKTKIMIPSSRNIKKKVSLKLNEMPIKKPDKNTFRYLLFSFEKRYQAKNTKEMNANKSENAKVFTTLCQLIVNPCKLYKKNASKDNPVSLVNL
jgi:hypothetical protein